MGRKKKMDVRRSRLIHSPDLLYHQNYDSSTHGLHPNDKYMREGRIPHIWCPGCGLGTITNAYIEAIKESNIDMKKHVIVSGIGCTARIAGYVNVDSYHTTHGRAIPFATGLKLANPDLIVTVITGDGDLAAIGGNHFIHGARRNVDINVICVNNFTYGMTGGQHGPTTPVGFVAPTMPYGSIENPFNLSHLAVASGADYVARWTTFHVRQIKNAIKEMFDRSGFCFTEIVSQCPTGFGRPNKMADPVFMLKNFRDKSIIDNNIPIEEAIAHPTGPIYIGKFLDKQNPTYFDNYSKIMDKFRPEGDKK